MASRALVRLFALNARLGLGLCPLPLASRGHLSLRGLSSTGGGLTAKGFSSTVGVNIEKAKVVNWRYYARFLQVLLELCYQDIMHADHARMHSILAG
eukprot:1368122-Amorphochlora_amoeboformis.AAC.1